MTGPSPTDALLGRYLLDSCSDDERRQVEEQFFASDDVFERLRELEEDVIERYRLDTLTAEERSRFERAYGSSPRRDRVLFAGALDQLVSRRAPVAAPIGRRPILSWLRLESTAFRLSLAAAAAVLIAGVLATVAQNRRLHSSLVTTQAEAQRLRQQQSEDRRRIEDLERRASDLSGRVAREGAPAAGAPRLLLSFVLSPGLVRGAGEPKRLVVPESVTELRLQLDLESGVSYKSFNAELRTGAGDVVWSQDMLRARTTDGGAAISLTVPAAVLNAGDYEVALRGLTENRLFEDTDHYYFGVVRR
jgi:anti-sigma factor RsiW